VGDTFAKHKLAEKGQKRHTSARAVTKSKGSWEMEGGMVVPRHKITIKGDSSGKGREWEDCQVSGETKGQVTAEGAGDVG